MAVENLLEARDGFGNVGRQGAQRGALVRRQRRAEVVEGLKQAPNLGREWLPVDPACHHRNLGSGRGCDSEQRKSAPAEKF